MMENMKSKFLKNSKHKDGSINCGKDYVEVKCVELFTQAQSLKQLVLNECKKTHSTILEDMDHAHSIHAIMMKLKMCHGTLIQSSLIALFYVVLIVLKCEN
jgi:hypothetical protein